MRHHKIWFWKRVDKTGECWLWTGALNQYGYGYYRYGGSVWGSHRFAYYLAYGKNPEGYVVRHTCDNPACVRPEHLQLGTHADNVRDRVKRGRSARGSANGRSKLKEKDIPVIRARLKEGDGMSVIAREYKVDPASIRHIRDGRNWKHVP